MTIVKGTATSHRSPRIINMAPEAVLPLLLELKNLAPLKKPL